jgi:transposase-like protein
MSSKRYPEEFKIEAVKQVTVRGNAAGYLAAFAAAISFASSSPLL